jgi:hypothetical protein
MLIKKADVKNHLAAKLRKHHTLRNSTVDQVSAGTSSADNEHAIATSGVSPEPLKPSSEFSLPLRSPGGH